MRRGNILARLNALEVRAPKDIVLYLTDGREFRYPGDFWEFAMEGLEGPEGPLVDACLKAVSAKGCGLLWEVVAATSEKSDKQ